MKEQEYYGQLESWGFIFSGDETNLTEIWVYDGDQDCSVPKPGPLTESQRREVLDRIGRMTGRIRMVHGPH